MGFALRSFSTSTVLTAESESFGFRQVRPGEKQELVKGVFSSVASQYDVMNDVMSAGLHRLWKDEMVSTVGLDAMISAQSVSNTDLRLLDVAGGTGDIAFRLIGKLERLGAFKEQEGAVTLDVADMNQDMLDVGEARVKEQTWASEEVASRICWTQANAQELPFPDNHFDIYTIAFGLRNVTHRDKALKDALRVLRPGGRFLCLEFSAVEIPIAASLYDLYSLNVIPELGHFVANDRDSYKYLVESIRTFPKQQELKREMSEAGFRHVSYKNMTGGIVALHSGFKI